LCQNWRIVLRYIGDLVSSGHVTLATVDSCKPGIVLWGEERTLRWCDRSPRWDLSYGRERWRLELLTEAVRRDLAELSTRFKPLVYYVNVKAYHLALLEASKALGLTEGVDYIDLTPGYSPLAYRSSRNLGRLRETILSRWDSHG
jgi:hypothetical protein